MFLLVIYGGVLLFANFAPGLARPAQMHSLLPCRQFAVVGVVFTHSNVVVLAQADVAVRGPVTGRQAVPQRVASAAATAVLVAAAAMMVASPAAAAAATVLLEATSPVAVSAPAETAAAPAFAPLLVVVVVLLGGCSGGHEGARDLALQVDPKLLLQLAAGQERLLPLPGGGVDAQNVVYELHQFWHAEGVVFKLWQAEVGGVEKAVYGFEGEVPWHDYPCQAAESSHSMLQRRHLRDFFHMLSN